MRQIQVGGGKALLWKKQGKGVDQRTQPSHLRTCGGIDEAKGELERLSLFSEILKRFTKLAKDSKGVLLIGAPGTGKTLLARAIAGKADVPFFTISGSDFVEMFVGVGASRVRDLFLKASGMLPASFSSTKSMPWEDIEERV